ncbi:MAG: DUF4838 domain-containing protein, partial [Clostridia bacterium]|nr:DUF4838 domain-containing protein [Clostridia bacterium]
TGVTQDCSAWTGGIDRGVLGQWNNGTLENVYLQVHTTNVVKEHYGVLCFGMDTGSKIANVVVEVTSDSTLFHYVMMTDNALADGNSVGVVGSYANGATESAESAWGVNSGFHQQLSWMVAEEANDELLTFTSPYWTIDATARTITMNPVKFTFETEEETPVGPEQPEIITEQVKVNETYYNEAGSLDLTGSGIDVSAITEITSGGTAVSFTANGNILTVAAGTSGAESEYVITTPAVIYTVTVLACDNAITTADEFTAWVAAPSGYVVLANDIDLKGATVGAETNMAGTFNGQGYAIYNLTTTGTTGVFKYVGGTFKNVQFINYTQDCENVAATRGLFGDNVWGTIENLLIQGQIINNSAGHNGIIVKYTSSGTFKNIVAYMESSATDKYHYGLTSGGDGTPTASNVYFVSSNSLGVAFNYDNSLGTVENCASYATEAAMLAAVDFSTWETPWTVNENGAPRMREISVPTILLSDVNAQIYDGKASLTLSALGISSSAVTKVTVGGANLWYEISNDALTINAAKSGTYKVVIYTVWSAYQVKVYCYNLEPVLLSGSVLAQSVDGQASVDLSAYDLQGAKIVGVTCGGVSIDFTHESNALTLVNAPYGDQTYELLTDGQYKYILDCCVYENGISTADQLNTWRNAGMTGYSVLLNDIDYNGATLTEGGYVIDATLDGRGYKITNFTYKNFVTRLYNNNAVVKNVYFDSITQDCSSWTGGIDQGLFGNWHSGVIENVYVNVTTTNMSGEHYATLFYGTEAGAVVRNVVVEIESTVDKFHYVYMKNEGAGAVVEGVVGSYGNSTGSTEGGNEAWGVNSGFHQQLSWMIAEEANDELLSFTSPYWVIDTAARTIELLPLAETKPAVVEDGYLVKESESAYAIVIDANNTSNAIRKAVTELQTLFKEATGVQLRCVTDSNATYASNVKYISLGYNNYTSDAGVSLGLNEEIGSQGYKIVTVEQSIIILGEPQGVLYGVYQLMHELFGFEQYTKDVYTLNGATTVALPDLKIVDAPDVEHRVAFSGVQLNDETSRNRMRTQHSGEIIMNNGNAHNMTRYIVPFDTYYSTNPTWYSSMTDSSDTYGTTQLCYTAGEYGSDNYNAMKAVAVASIKEIILANPQADMMSLTQMDVEGMWCSCSGCQAIISQYGEESATQILFVNDVVSEIETWLNNEQGGREVKFMMFAYYETQEAPTGLTLNENVSVWIAPIKDNYTTGVNASGNSMGSMLSDWKNVASSVAIWAYGVYFSEYLVPYNTFDYIDQLVDACVASNAEYMWIQGNWNTTQNTGFDSLKAYLISKLMWDSTLDVNTLTDNYFNAVYGAAADKMKEVYTEMKTELASMSLSGNIYDAPCGFSEWDNSYLTAQLDRLVAAIGMLDSNAADYQTIYDAIVCESISFRYIYKENSLLGLGGNYSTDAWGTFEEDVARLGFTMVSEQKTMEAYLA